MEAVITVRNLKNVRVCIEQLMKLYQHCLQCRRIRSPKMILTAATLTPSILVLVVMIKWRSQQHTVYVRWMDTKPVHILSTAFNPTELFEVQRMQKNGTRAPVTCPASVVQYTKRMGGVDRLDHLRGSYSFSRRSRRWWLRIFYFALDCSIVNAHILHTSVHPEDSIPMIQFQLLLFRALLANYTSRDRRAGIGGQPFVRRRGTHKTIMQKPPGVPEDIRLTRVGLHMPQALPSFHRCRLCSSRKNNKRSKVQCGTCGVALCVIPCFADFHK
jgi:hypothetical protein